MINQKLSLHVSNNDKYIHNVSKMETAANEKCDEQYWTGSEAIPVL